VFIYANTLFIGSNSLTDECCWGQFAAR